MALERIDWPRDDPRWFGCLTTGLSFWHHIPWLYAGNKEFDRGTYLPCFRLILERCGPNLVGGGGRTALHEVAAKGEWVTEEEATGFATALLDAGARTDVRDDILKSTPLGWACRWGRARVVKAMLERGADPVEADAEPWARPRAWAFTGTAPSPIRNAAANIHPPCGPLSSRTCSRATSRAFAARSTGLD
jgi:hypothetical protein